MIMGYGEYEPEIVFGFGNFSTLSNFEFGHRIALLEEEFLVEEDFVIECFAMSASKGSGCGHFWGVPVRFEAFPVTDGEAAASEAAEAATVGHAVLGSADRRYVQRIYEKLHTLVTKNDWFDDDEVCCAVRLCLSGDIDE